MTNDNRKKLLDIFVSNSEHDQKTRPWLCTPFHNTWDGRLWAADGYIALVMSGQDDVNNFPEYDKPIRMNNFVKKKLCSLSINDFKELFASDELSDINANCVCPVCHGTCEVQYEFYCSMNGETYYTYDDCPVCDGTGYLDRFNYYQVSIADISYNVNAISKIYEAMKIFDSQSIDLYIDETKQNIATIFQLTDNVQIYVYPTNDNSVETIKMNVNGF